MSEDKSMKEHHWNFDTVNSDHTVRGSRDLCVPVEAHLVVALKHIFHICIHRFSVSWNSQNLTWDSVAYCERITGEPILTTADGTVIIYSTDSICATDSRTGINAFLVDASFVKTTF